VRSLDDEERMLLAEFQAEYDESAETVRSQQTEREIE
jgi:protein-S-isoprenylcysteine O-methyltransferase Ste14